LAHSLFELECKTKSISIENTTTVSKGRVIQLGHPNHSFGKNQQLFWKNYRCCLFRLGIWKWKYLSLAGTHKPWSSM